MKDSFETHAASQDKPMVLLEYLFEEESPLNDDGCRCWIEQNEKHNRARRSLRHWWMQGRWRSEYLHLIDAETDDAGPRSINATAICEWLNVSAQAVSQWTQGQSVIAPENLELLRRHLLKTGDSNNSLSQHDRDSSGYRFAITMLKRKASKNVITEVMKLRTFWLLWYLLRSTEWLLATTREDWEAVSQNVGDALRELILDNCIAGLSPADAVLPEFDEFTQSMAEWGMAFCQVTVELDEHCWTSPHV